MSRLHIQISRTAYICHIDLSHVSFSLKKRCPLFYREVKCLGLKCKEKCNGMSDSLTFGCSFVVDKYRRLAKTHVDARIGQSVLSGILPVICRCQEHRNYRRMAINTQVQSLYRRCVWTTKCYKGGEQVGMYYNGLF